MKKLLAIMIAAVMSIAVFTACAANTANAQETVTPQAQEEAKATPVVEETEPEETAAPAEPEDVFGIYLMNAPDGFEVPEQYEVIKFAKEYTPSETINQTEALAFDEVAANVWTYFTVYHFVDAGGADQYRAYGQKHKIVDGIAEFEATESGIYALEAVRNADGTLTFKVIGLVDVATEKFVSEDDKTAEQTNASSSDKKTSTTNSGSKKDTDTSSTAPEAPATKPETPAEKPETPAEQPETPVAQPTPAPTLDLPEWDQDEITRNGEAPDGWGDPKPEDEEIIDIGDDMP